MTNDNQKNCLNIRQITALVFMMIALPLIFDQLVFRGFYLSYLEPESTAGITLLARSIQKANYSPGKKNVLILGDSRIGEGFSARIANEVGSSQGFNFVGIGLPGTTPRVWYYVLRDLDIQRNNYYAIFMLANSLRDDDVYDDYSNRSLDTSYLAPLLNWEDIFSYPLSFSDPKEAMKATTAVAFPSASLKNDVIEFLKAPFQRITKAVRSRTEWPSAVSAYSGHEESLPPSETPFSAERVLSRLNGASRTNLDRYFHQYLTGKPQPEMLSFVYRSKWYGQIAHQYATTAVTVGVFLIPRGPYHAALNKPAEAKGSLKILEQKGMISLVDTAVSLRLEKPEFFFDHLHLNAAGRVEFSRNLALAIITQLKD